MKLKNYEILDIKEAFNRATSTLTLPIAIAWKRRLNYEKINNISRIIFEALDDVSKNYTDDKYSYIEEETGNRKVRDEYIAEFTQKRSEILNQETEIDIQMVDIEDLGDNLTISDSDMDTLAFMINK